MKILFLFASLMIFGTVLNKVTATTIEISLPAQDCHSGQFYIGRFSIGSYEVSCNVTGYDANNCGWKLLIGKNYGSGPVRMTELHNILGGRFFVMNEGPSVFHLWWFSEYKNINKLWTPRLAVDYQAGSFSADNPLAVSDAAVELRSNILLRSSNIGIGTNSPGHKLDVNGTIRAKEIKVEAQTADFVFESDYSLRSLYEVGEFIRENKHLPDIPSASQMEVDGVDLAAMNKLLLMKIEELTLYVIKKDIEVQELRLEVDIQQAKLKELDMLRSDIESVKSLLLSRPSSF